MKPIEIPFIPPYVNVNPILYILYVYYRYSSYGDRLFMGATNFSPIIPHDFRLLNPGQLLYEDSIVNFFSKMTVELKTRLFLTKLSRTLQFPN